MATATRPTRSPLLDVGLVEYTPSHDTELARQRHEERERRRQRPQAPRGEAERRPARPPELAAVARADYSAAAGTHRYLLHLDGHSFSNRLQALLLSNSLVLKQQSEYVEYYYRALFETHFKGFDQFVHVWEGGCRAGGAPWQNSAYTRAGLKDTAQLQHGLMEGVDVVTEAATGKKVAAAAAAKPRAGSPAMAATVGSTPLNRRFVVDSPSHAAPSAVPPQPSWRPSLRPSSGRRHGDCG